jgi:hypothetical protein
MRLHTEETRAASHEHNPDEAESGKGRGRR